PVHTENISAKRSALSYCCCSPPRSTAALPRCEPHPARAYPQPEYQIVCRRPSAHPILSPRHPTIPRSHIPNHPYNPCARCLPELRRFFLAPCGSISDSRSRPPPPPSAVCPRSVPAAPELQLFPKCPRRAHPY